jgi:polyhydroxybutyrate depolymerase
MARRGFEFPNLPTQSLRVGAHERTYSMVPGPTRNAPLLMVLHGAGSTGLGMAALTGLDKRGPAAGCAVVFPNGWGRVWTDQQGADRSARRQGIDDAVFLRALVDQLDRTHMVDTEQVFGVGMSNGGLLAEHLARYGLLKLKGIVLVAGGATVMSRQACPVPRATGRVLLFHGTADPLVPYQGGPIGPMGRRVQRRSARQGGSPVRGVVAPIEGVATDWAEANATDRAPAVDQLPVQPNDLGVTRLRWLANQDERVVLYRVEGGGHTWPGGAQYLPQRIIGPVAHRLDATGILLDFTRKL